MKHLFFTLFSLMVCTMLRAYDAKIDGIYYNISGNKATVTYRDAFYDSYKGDLVIPESISYNGKTYSVTSIGHLAISNCTSLNSITIPKSITTIEESAFYWCPSLTSITIPGSVKSIGNHAFYHCTNLTSVTILDGLTSIGSGAFVECDALTSIIIPNSVTSIGEYNQEIKGETNVEIIPVSA
ncbi:MAG: leucine-rich repeat domain-containing protein [Bacteroidaceae bacterium]|nr:leucine-rich repeat domain-containing protein [Bacteroidaceae bacterium]